MQLTEAIVLSGIRTNDSSLADPTARAESVLQLLVVGSNLATSVVESDAIRNVPSGRSAHGESPICVHAVAGFGAGGGGGRGDCAPRVRHGILDLACIREVLRETTGDVGILAAADENAPVRKHGGGEVKAVLI